MSDSTPEPIGVRVARARKQRGLTQNGLAQRTSYSRSLIAQVEAGHRVATPAFVVAVAAALGLDVADVYGQPFEMAGKDDPIRLAIPELRKVLAYVGVGPDLEAPPRGLDALDAETKALRGLLDRARYSRVGMRLPAVVEELTHHAYETDAPRAWALLYRAHHLAAGFTRRLGYSGDALAWMDRFEESARRSGDPHLPLMTSAPRALILMGMSQYRPALKLLDRARTGVQPGFEDSGEVTGYLALRAAAVAARAGQASAAWDYYGEASEVIESGRLNKQVHDVQFVPENVTIHGAALALELGDLDEASRRDRQIGEATLRGLAPERRAHHEIDMARMHVELGDHAKATTRIINAEKVAPQMTRFHPTARAVVTHLGDVRRTLPEPLRGLQRRMGL